MSDLQRTFEAVLMRFHKLHEFTTHACLVRVGAWVAAELGQEVESGHGVHGGAGAGMTGIPE
jgi:hypothetical protein